MKSRWVFVQLDGRGIASAGEAALDGTLRNANAGADRRDVAVFDGRVYKQADVIMPVFDTRMRAEISVFDWLFARAGDYDDIERPLLRFEFQAELFLDGGENRRSGRGVRGGVGCKV